MKAESKCTQGHFCVLSRSQLITVSVHIFCTTGTFIQLVPLLLRKNNVVTYKLLTRDVHLSLYSTTGIFKEQQNGVELCFPFPSLLDSLRLSSPPPPTTHSHNPESTFPILNGLKLYWRWDLSVTQQTAPTFKKLNLSPSTNMCKRLVLCLLHKVCSTNLAQDTDSSHLQS